jgi:UDP-N-acetylglucosamine acyltransferase
MRAVPTIEIHPTAIVAPDAVIADGVTIGPYVVIQENVTIGANCFLGPHTVVQGPTIIGKNNKFYGYVAVGTDPQDLKYGGEPTRLEIGDDNRIREFVTLNRGTEDGGGLSRIGSRNLLMTGVHVAHDCFVGNDVILANAATLAGHVEVGNSATVGAFCGVHQFCRVGVHAFIGGYSVLTRDVLPFVKTVGIRNTAKTYGINTIGLTRKGFSEDRVKALNSAYRTLFRKGVKLADAILEVRESSEMTPDVEILLGFVESSERGFVR